MKKEFIKQAAKDYLVRKGETAAAQYLAENLFEGITDKAGKPYVGHLRRVADGVDDDISRPVAWMHDLLEDIDNWTAADLAAIGFNDKIIAGVEAMTHTADMLYLDMIVKLGTVAQAVPVKLSDLEDNSNPLRLPWLVLDRDVERLKKYKMAHAYLSDVSEANIKPGTRLTDWLLTKPDTMRDWSLVTKYSRESPDVSPYIYPGLGTGP